MLPEERLNLICEAVNKQKSMRVSELSSLLSTSEATIRRDLEKLDERKKIIRTHGGAVALYPVGKAISVPDLMSSQKCEYEKKLISQVAYGRIQDDETIIADGSTTCLELIKQIAGGKKKNLKIVTTSTKTVDLLSNQPNCNVILIGGEYNYAHNTTEGYLATKMIRDVRADKCFIGINGIDEHFGYSTPRPGDAELKSLMVQSARHSYLLADYTKFDRTYFARVDAEVDYIITDSRKPNISYRWLRNRTTLIFADEALGTVPGTEGSSAL